MPYTLHLAKCTQAYICETERVLLLQNVFSHAGISLRDKQGLSMSSLSLTTECVLLLQNVFFNAGISLRDKQGLSMSSISLSPRMMPG